MMFARQAVAGFAAATIFLSPAAAQESPQIAQGKALYGQFCTQCHGADGKRTPEPSGILRDHCGGLIAIVAALAGDTEPSRGTAP